MSNANETVLTDEQISAFMPADIQRLATCHQARWAQFARAIERAVLSTIDSEQKVPVPVNAISKVLNDLMEVYVQNGANSISMPDECVEVALFLSYQQESSEGARP